MRANGWRRIPQPMLAYAISEFEAHKTEMDERERKIAQYILFENISASAISRKMDIDIVGRGNRSMGKPLSPSSILDIFYRRFPYMKVPTKSREQDMRVQLIRHRQKCKSPHIQQCAFCGNKTRLEEHHMIPISMGGTNDERNLIFLCHECHLQATQYQMDMQKTKQYPFHA